MGKMVQLTASDGHTFGAYRAEPAGKPKGGLIVVMEIFGVNSHIRKVTDEYAADGYLAIAPAMFDRAQRGLDVGYTPQDMEIARGLMQKINFADAIKDVEAAMQHIASAGKTSIVGFCWGGSVAWKSACNVRGLSCAIPYYGGAIPSMIAEQPKCPVLCHWGETDQSISLADVDTIKQKRPDIEVHVYPAGHGFSCDARASYHEPSHKQALERTLAWLQKYVG